MTIQDLRPNSQDTSAFYLGNIYEVLADPNATRAPIPSPVAKPPPFTRPRYAVWVNSLWFLSLVMSLSCALWATSLQQWARRYIRLTQPARRTPEKRARMRAFYADGVDKMHIPWAVEGLPTLLHLSLFLFFGGLAIFLFNVDEEVFICVVSWIGLFSTVYGLITFLPLVWQDSPYFTPLSKPVWFLYFSIPYATFLPIITFYNRSQRSLFGRDQIWNIWWRYRYRWMEKTAEKTADEQSPKIDVRIFGWTISALGDDYSLEKFFEAIPGLFNSTLVRDLEKHFPDSLLETFWNALHDFIDRTLSSNSIAEEVKSRRSAICKDIISMIPRPYVMIPDPFSDFFDEAPVSIERLQVMARWRSHQNDFVADSARIRAAKSLTRMQKRDGRWMALASDISGISELDLQNDVALAGNGVLLATLIDISRRAIHSDDSVMLLTEGLPSPILNTHPRIQHDFCSLWNELTQEARNQGSFSTPVQILRNIRQHYILLH